VGSKENEKKIKFILYRVCPECELLCLGTYPKSFALYGDQLSSLGVEIWYSSKYNMGMAIGKQIWERIRSPTCSKVFTFFIISKKYLPFIILVFLRLR
jgi:hypothetical protein